MQKVPKTMVSDWDILNYLCIVNYIHHAYKLSKDELNTVLLTVDVVFFVFGIKGIQNMANQKLWLKQMQIL